MGVDDHLFVLDAGNRAVREVTPDGKVTTIAGRAGVGYKDGDGASAQFNNLVYDIAADSKGYLYIADVSNNRIRKMVWK
jgi:hypothetical protein